MLNDYLASHNFAIQYSEEEIAHFLLPKDKVIYTFVDGPVGGKLTDLFSFYYLPSQVLKHEQYSELCVCYTYYNVSTTGRLQEGMQDMLLKAQ